MTTTQTPKEGLALLLCAVFALNGCMRTNNIKTDADGISQGVKVGDEVNITTHDATEYNLWVREIGEDSLTGSEGQDGKGEHQTIAYADIESITVTELNGTATAGIVVGLLLVIGLIVAARNADPLFGPACC